MMVSKQRTSQVRPKSPKRALDANAERDALKRTYLMLLPHAQLVELCLAFESLFARLYQKFTLTGEPRGRGRRVQVAVGASAIAPLAPINLRHSLTKTSSPQQPHF
jgi:hypothetical protein